MWAGQLKEEMEKRTGRSDIGVTISPYRSYDVLVGATAEGLPIVDFYADIQQDSKRVASALDYASEMLHTWEATKILHETAVRDCLPFYERLKTEFPHMELHYNVVEFNKHSVLVTKSDDKIVASFDLWPRMSEDDVGRIASYLKDFEGTLHREEAKMAGATYFWK